ncbi:MAG: hypothetical protein CO187_09265 [Zetaproteobacteria bacterium CG_4_9_14_3_um_filter_53_7]|nr:MAG: hypothetical protein CO187_09265 [Zetaproteobacteria bacterium CG_4_9_14_3_um_filter_53_7]
MQMKIKMPDFLNRVNSKHKQTMFPANEKRNSNDHFSWGLLPGSFDPVFPEPDNNENKKQ